jgi:hypothetical protein
MEAAITRPTSKEAARRPPPPPPAGNVREVVRDLLVTSSRYQALEPEDRRTVAQSIVQIADTAMTLAKEDATARPADAVARPVLAQAQSAGGSFSGVAASKVADTTKQILNAVSFPRFVTELIIGVFKALNDSNQQQMRAYVELIQNVAASTEGFADANIGVSGARSWLAERFPGSFVIEGDEADDFGTPPSEMSPEERAAAQAERDASTKLRLKPGASMPSEAALKTALGLGAQDALPGGDPENLVGLARMSLARNRQQMLSSMVMMGLQRLVVESGRLNASMRFHIDTRSAASEDSGSSFDMRNETSGNVGAKFGPWGVDAKVKNTIGFVSTQKTQTTEEMNTDLDLNSSVELLFKTDYVQLDRLAGGPAQERIRVNSLNPEAELKLASADRAARRSADAAAESARSTQLNERLAPVRIADAAAPSKPATPAGAPSGGAGTPPAGGGAAATPPAGGSGTQIGATPPAGGGGASQPAGRGTSPPTGGGVPPPGGAGASGGGSPQGGARSPAPPTKPMKH